MTRGDNAEFEIFAAAVAHEIRTPLSAVAGEVELALRRPRSAAEYRDALERVAAGITELVEISGDLALLGDGSVDPDRTRPAHLDTILATLCSRYEGRDDVSVHAAAQPGIRIEGHEARLARAVILLIEHALRHRQGNATVRVRGEVTAASAVRLIVDAPESAFWPRAWHWLKETPRTAAGPLRLRTALRIVERSGGTLVVNGPAHAESVQIELRPSL